MLTQRPMTWVFTTGLVLLLSGCPKPYPHCATDEACKAQGEVCVQGQCRECATDQNCKSGFSCDKSTFRCVPKGECASDTECGEGKGCRSGRCVSKPTASPERCDTDVDCPEGMGCQGGRCVSAMGCDFSAVRFGFNETSLTSETKERLKAIAECLRAEKARVTLEGHADERGTEEYNLQLSNRRASTVKRYLTDLGVSTSLLETVGYGEERPVASGQNEVDWAANRRVEFNKR